MNDLRPNRKLTEPQRMQVLAMIARGDSYNQINNFLDAQYGFTLGISSLSDTKKRHIETVEAMKSAIQEAEIAETELLLKKSRRILNKKLDRAENDMSELELLDEQYRNNEIESSEYKRKKATLLNISITEISMVSKNLHDQTKKIASDDTETPAKDNRQATEQLLAAIKSGNEVELQRIILNPAH